MALSTEVDVRCDLESLYQARSGAIWGGVWLEHGEYCFPERGWNDLVVAFMLELIRANQKLAGGDTIASVAFFDGPLAVELTYDHSGLLAIEKKGPEKAGPRTLTTSWEPWVGTVRVSAQRLVEACEKRSWSSQSDVTLLRQLINASSHNDV